MSTVTVTIPDDLGPIAAPVLIGSLLNWGLFGALSIQVYMYYLSFPKDRWTAKFLVYSVFLIDTAQTILVTNDVFNVYAEHYGQPDVLTAIQNEWLAVPVFSGIVSCIVQMYYAYRIEKLSGSRMLQLVISVLAVIQGVAAIVTGVQVLIAGTFQALQTTSVASCGIWLAGSALCDVVIAGLMAYLLLRSDTNFTETHAIITRLVRLIIETGALTAVAATLDLILYFALPYTNYHSCIAIILSKLYSNSLLVVLNSRIRIIGGRNLVSSEELDGAGDPRRVYSTLVFADPNRTTTTTTGNVRTDEGGWTDTDELTAEQRNSREETKKPLGLREGI